MFICSSQHLEVRWPSIQLSTHLSKPFHTYFVLFKLPYCFFSSFKPLFCFLHYVEHTNQYIWLLVLQFPHLKSLQSTNTDDQKWMSMLPDTCYESVCRNLFCRFCDQTQLSYTGTRLHSSKIPAFSLKINQTSKF